jgi:preprotein translocase subunit SecF
MMYSVVFHNINVCMLLYPLKLVPDNTQINFIKLSKYLSIISAFVLVLGCSVIYLKGFNFGIDFVGGTQLEIKSDKFVPLDKMRKVLTDLNLGEVSLQYQGQGERDSEIVIKIARMQGQTASCSEIIKNALNQAFLEHKFEYLSVNFIGPQINSYLIKSGIKAVILSVLGIFIYIWIRFKLSFGFGILVTLLHNLVLCFAFLSVSGIDFNQATIAGLLIIIGYCVNDSIVIYDKILSNATQMKVFNQAIVNLSINKTLSRTVLTSFTTLLANLALIIFGGKTIFSFSILVFAGILIGTYTSIVFSGPIVLYLSGKKKVAPN